MAVDHELVAYLDRRFAEVDRRFTELEHRLDVRFTNIDAKLAEHDARFVEHEILFAGLDTKITETAEETRRHSGVVAEGLRDEIRLVAEGVLTVDQKLERFRGEVAEEFRRVDTRLLRLEARILG